MRSVTNHIEIGGAQLAYEIIGEGEPLVLLHGFTLDRRMWEPQVEYLSRYYTVVLCDMPGFGESEDPKDATSLGAPEIVEFICRLGFCRTHICGLSLGGAFALEAALLQPELVATLTLVSAGIGGYAFGADYVGLERALQEKTRDGDLKAALQEWLAVPLFQQAFAQPHLEATLRGMVEGYQGWHWKNRTKRLDMKTITRLEQVQCPTLVVASEHDHPDFSKVAEVLVDRIPDAIGVTLIGAGHLSTLERPDAFNETLQAFLSKHPLEGVDQDHSRDLR